MSGERFRISRPGSETVVCGKHPFGPLGPDDVASTMLAFAGNNFASTHCTPGTAATIGQHGWTAGLSMHDVGRKRLCCCRAIIATVEMSLHGARFSFERVTIDREPLRDTRRRLELRTASGSAVTTRRWPGPGMNVRLAPGFPRTTGRADSRQIPRFILGSPSPSSRERVVAVLNGGRAGALTS